MQNFFVLHFFSKILKFFHFYLLTFNRHDNILVYVFMSTE